MSESSESVKIGGKALRLTNLGKPLYPSGFTKGQVIDYYAKIAPAILPHLRGRPVSFKRYPNGTAAPFFFQKNRPEHAPKWVKSVKVHGRESGTIDYCLVDNLATLVWAANSAALELHVPLGKAKADNRPNFVVFDLDPGPGVTLLECARLALRLRDFLRGAGLESFVKTSGSKGLHVLAPLNTAGTFEKSRAFAREVASALEKDDPGRVTATMAKAQRQGKVFVDWNQNARHQTTVCAYSLRGTAQPGISTPLAWAEVEQAVKRKKADRLVFTPDVVLKRVDRDGDLLAALLSMKQRLPKSLAEVKVAPAARAKPPTSKSTTGHPKPPKAAGQGRAPRKKPSASLKAYRAKRDFGSSPEPDGRSAPADTHGDSAPSFCVQKHQASRLHYDFRLQHNGVLLSWAVPKGPSLRPEDKRLAVRVEDHPLDYGDFEGVIPSGYGAGIVMLWDRGTWHPQVDDVDAALEKGDLKFSLEGVKLKGSWVLVRTRGPRSADGKNWLLIKHRDHWAGDIDIAEAAPLSVKTFRDFREISAAGTP